MAEYYHKQGLIFKEILSDVILLSCQQLTLKPIPKPFNTDFRLLVQYTSIAFLSTVYKVYAKKDLGGGIAQFVSHPPLKLGTQVRIPVGD